MLIGDLEMAKCRRHALCGIDIRTPSWQPPMNSDFKHGADAIGNFEELSRRPIHVLMAVCMLRLVDHRSLFKTASSQFVCIASVSAR